MAGESAHHITARHVSLLVKSRLIFRSDSLYRLPRVSAGKYAPFSGDGLRVNMTLTTTLNRLFEQV